MIRVLVVEDSVTVRHRLIEILQSDPDLVVVGEAGDGQRALELAKSLRPDVITLDLVLPTLDGLGVTEQIMAHVPTPILIVSAAENRGEVFETYQALAAGAVDVLDKPTADHDGWDARFIAAVRMTSRIRVITHPRGRLGAIGRARAPVLASRTTLAVPLPRAEVVAIGASTGGPAAIAAVVGALPRDFPIPVIVVLHIDAPFARSFAAWLGSHTNRDVAVAAEGDPIAGPPGRVLFAPPGRHLVVEKRRVRLVADAPRHHCRPSIDTLFESIARDYGSAAAACLLTGMGRDGAAGLLAIRRAGGLTIAQDEATSVVYGMPREAVECGAAECVLPVDDIGRMFATLATTKEHAS